MSANAFIKQYYGQEKEGIGAKISGALPASKKHVNKAIDELAVDSMENTLHIHALYQHLGIEMPDLEYQAVEMVGARREKKVLDMKFEEYQKREDAYLQGSILEKSRRFFGGAPVNPLKEDKAPVVNITLPEGLLAGAQGESPKLQAMEVQLQTLEKSLETLIGALSQQFDQQQPQAQAEVAK